MQSLSLLDYLVLASCAGGISCSVIANRHLVPGKEDAFQVFFLRERTDFTDKGWKFRQIALGFCYLTFGVIVANGIT